MAPPRQCQGGAGYLLPRNLLLETQVEGEHKRVATKSQLMLWVKRGELCGQEQWWEQQTRFSHEARGLDRERTHLL